MSRRTSTALADGDHLLIVPPGSLVGVAVDDRGNFPARVLAAHINPGGAVRYSVAYWDGLTRREEQVLADELSTAPAPLEPLHVVFRPPQGGGDE